MKFYSEQLNKLFNSEKELIAAEKVAADAKAKAEAEKKAKIEAQEKLKAARKTRAEEVEKAFVEAAKAQKHAQELLDKFLKDYNSFHMTYKDVESIPAFDTLIDSALKFFC